MLPTSFKVGLWLFFFPQQLARRQIHSLEEQNKILSDNERKLNSHIGALELERTALLQAVAALRIQRATDVTTASNGKPQSAADQPLPLALAGELLPNGVLEMSAVDMKAKKRITPTEEDRKKIQLFNT